MRVACGRINIYIRRGHFSFQSLSEVGKYVNISYISVDDNTSSFMSSMTHFCFYIAEIHVEYDMKSIVRDLLLQTNLVGIYSIYGNTCNSWRQVSLIGKKWLREKSHKKLFVNMYTLIWQISKSCMSTCISCTYCKKKLECVMLIS